LLSPTVTYASRHARSNRRVGRDDDDDDNLPQFDRRTTEFGDSARVREIHENSIRLSSVHITHLSHLTSSDRILSELSGCEATQLAARLRPIETKSSRAVLSLIGRSHGKLGPFTAHSLPLGKMK